MKKYVLNIEKLYTGQTSNALVLNQVDCVFPDLIPQFINGDQDEFVRKWNLKYSSFTPSESDDINEYIMDFNLNLQNEFKNMGHSELYMMDDTKKIKNVNYIPYPSSNSSLSEWIKQYKKDDFVPPSDESQLIDYIEKFNQERRDSYLPFDTEKTYMHCLNGLSDDKYVRTSSQLNVIFPYRKMTNKSLYQSNLLLNSKQEIDDSLEVSRNITLQGKVSYEKCVQSIARVGNNIYIMSPNIGIDKRFSAGQYNTNTMYGNGLTIINGFDMPFHFPHSMTLFQPSQDKYKYVSEDNLTKEFIEWFETHDLKTVVSISQEYGSNVSNMTYYGNGSYDIDISTYSPTDIVRLQGDGTIQLNDVTRTGLNEKTFRQIRSGMSRNGKYKDGRYIIDNNTNGMGFLFNLYDNFISGTDRIIRMKIPQDKDYNELYIKFDVNVLFDESKLVQPFEAVVSINEVLDGQILNSKDVYKYKSTDTKREVKDSIFFNAGLMVSDTAIQDHTYDFVVRIHYPIDYNKRTSNKDYGSVLMNSGIVLSNIRIENGVNSIPEHLTWGSYINEPNISQDEHDKRYEQFWKVSNYILDVSYQTVLESSLKNINASGISYLNNYSSGDMFGDLFVTKTLLNSMYDMSINDFMSDILHVHGRNYLSVGQCSNQLFLTYDTSDIFLSQDKYGQFNVSSIKDDDISKSKNNDTMSKMNYQLVEVVKNINRFESSIKHKPNVFSIQINNSNLAKTTSLYDDKMEKYKVKLRDSITQFVRDTCSSIAPVHTQLFDVQFT